MLAIVSAAGLHRASTTLPRTGTRRISRSPGSLRGGLSFSGFVVGTLVAVIVLFSKPRVWEDRSSLIALLMTVVPVAALLVATIVIPSAVLGRSRESLRRKIATDARFREWVERDFAEWRAAGGAGEGYGPR